MTQEPLVARAPGKLVLWGEYAVLTGAPAAALPVDRYAEGRLALRPAQRHWQIDMPGLVSEPLERRLDFFLIESMPTADTPGALLWHVLTALGARANDLPMGAHLLLDSSGFRHEAGKLGLGSSAATAVALSAVLERALGQSPSFALPFRAHEQFQGGRGSGLDVAAAFYGGGGLVHFRRESGAETPAVGTAPWPDALHWRAYFSGSSASTTAHLQSFDSYRAAHPDSAALKNLSAAAAALTADFTLAQFAAYRDALRAFDQHAQLGIYTPVHQELHTLAAQAGVTYKPCGAGGGDCGIALALSPEGLEAFDGLIASRLSQLSVQPLDLRIATHGIAHSG